MKIEKLTDNKIRVVMKFDENYFKNNKLHNLYFNIINSHDLFLDILKKAEKDFDFKTDGCKLLIESFSTVEDSIVFTITKFANTDFSTYKKIIAKKRKSLPFSKTCIYKFNNLDTFYDFCNYLSSMSSLEIDKISKKVSLYEYNDGLYLVFKNINFEYDLINRFFITLSEFADIKNFSYGFENKLIEHGKILLKNNALISGIKYLI